MSDRDRDAREQEHDAPPTDEELREATALREALAREAGGVRGMAPEARATEAADASRDLAVALRAAWTPEGLDGDEHRALLADVPSADELALAAELRDALEADQDRRAPSIVTALQAAWSPEALGEDEHRAIVRRAVGDTTTNVVPLHSARRANVVRLVTVTASTVLALAASVLVWVTAGPPSAPSEQAALPSFAKARSTQSLFAEPFRAGETSARIDKIALARAGDFRDNRFAKWGVR